MTPEERIEVAELAIRAQGFEVRYVEWCEDADTPGLLGSIRGVTDWGRREVKVSGRAHESPEEMADTLLHELHHVLDPEWDCGNRDLFGRGGGCKHRSVVDGRCERCGTQLYTVHPLVLIAARGSS